MAFTAKDYQLLDIVRQPEEKLDEVKQLIGQGANILVFRENEGELKKYYTVFNCAISNGHLQILEYIINILMQIYGINLSTALVTNAQGHRIPLNHIPFADLATRSPEKLRTIFSWNKLLIGDDLLKKVIKSAGDSLDFVLLRQLITIQVDNYLEEKRTPSGAIQLDSSHDKLLHSIVTRNTEQLSNVLVEIKRFGNCEKCSDEHRQEYYVMPFQIFDLLSAVELACLYDFPESFDLFLEHKVFNIIRKQEMSPLLIAVKLRNENIVKKILEVTHSYFFKLLTKHKIISGFKKAHFYPLYAAIDDAITCQGEPLSLRIINILVSASIETRDQRVRPAFRYLRASLEKFMANQTVNVPYVEAILVTIFTNLLLPSLINREYRSADEHILFPYGDKKNLTKKEKAISSIFRKSMTITYRRLGNIIIDAFTEGLSEQQSSSSSEDKTIARKKISDSSDLIYHILSFIINIEHLKKRDSVENEEYQQALNYLKKNHLEPANPITIEEYKPLPRMAFNPSVQAGSLDSSSSSSSSQPTFLISPDLIDILNNIFLNIRLDTRIVEGVFRVLPKVLQQYPNRIDPIDIIITCCGLLSMDDNIKSSIYVQLGTIQQQQDQQMALQLQQQFYQQQTQNIMAQQQSSSSTDPMPGSSSSRSMVPFNPSQQPSSSSGGIFGTPLSPIQPFHHFNEPAFVPTQQQFDAQMVFDLQQQLNRPPAIQQPAMQFYPNPLNYNGDSSSSSSSQPFGTRKRKRRPPQPAQQSSSSTDNSSSHSSHDQPAALRAEIAAENLSTLTPFDVVADAMPVYNMDTGDDIIEDISSEEEEADEEMSDVEAQYQ